MTTDLLDDPLLSNVPVHEGYKVLGGVVLYQKLGRGGMGAVYRGRHLRLDIDVAVKVAALPPGTPAEQTESFLKRFIREARTAAAVRHPNLIRVYDVNSEAGVHFLIMDHIDGESAADRLERKGRLSEQEAVEIALGAAEGLAAARSQGIVHRDVKPDNILIDKKGNVVVADLGLAKAYVVEDEGRRPSTVTQTGVALGTPYYMSPEQFRPTEGIGPGSDVWSLGVTLYQLLTARLPWTGANVFEIADNVRRRKLPDPKKLCESLSGGVCGIMRKATQKKASQRHADCGEMAEALRAHLDSVRTSSESVLSGEVAGTTKLALAAMTPPAAEERRAEAKKRLGPAKTLILDLGGGVTMQLVRIPAGDFMMGSRDSAEEVARKVNTKPKYFTDEHPQHRVRITKAFYMGKYEVTQAQYERVMGKNPSKFKGASNPVEQASWNDATEFCRKLSQRTGRKVRLPTEAEWEYACRAGTTTPFHFGRSLSSSQANFDGDYPYGGAAKGVFRGKTTSVGSFPGNAWGLHDMHGNVWEWCSDWYDKGYYAKSPREGPAGPANGGSRVLRGGSWIFFGGICRSARRGRDVPAMRGYCVGFRVVLAVSPGR